MNGYLSLPLVLLTVGLAAQAWSRISFKDAFNPLNDSCNGPDKIASSGKEFLAAMLRTSRCIKKDYLDSGEIARPFRVHMADIPPENIDKDLTAYFPEIIGPETVEVRDDTAYTGADDGWIYKIDLTQMTATQLATACNASGVTDCRPLGIRATSDNKLYFVDTAGLCVYDIDTDEVKVLVPRLSEVEGEPFKLPNDLDIDESTNTIYMSDGSTRYDNNEVLRGTLLHDASGRVLQYNIKTGEVSVLVPQLSFPNGIQLSHDKKTLLVNEFNKMRVLKVVLNGNRRGKWSVFTDGIPGEPDNIRLGSNGGYWVGVNLARNNSEWAIFDYLSDSKCCTMGFIRTNDFVADYLSHLAEWTNHDEYKDVADKLSSYQFVSELASPQGNIIKIDEKGKIVKRYVSEQFGYFSNPIEYKNSLLVGNDRNPQIVKIDGIIEG